MGGKEDFNGFFVMSGELLFKCQRTEMQHRLKGEKGSAGSREAPRGKWDKIEEVKISTGVNL